ncbi:hypothetical protein LPJ66_004191, partial [Kickxella alabastrina]
DRRPIDPPPIIQLIVQDPLNPNSNSYTTNPTFFMQVVLMDEAAKAPLRYLKGHRAAAMAGSMVSPLHTLRDASSMQGAYFVFSDLSVRTEGSFRLRFDLFEMEGEMVHQRASIISDIFSVYSPKRFPGMMESTRLSKLFAEQGLRIRIRTEAGTKKRGKKLACELEFASKCTNVDADVDTDTLPPAKRAKLSPLSSITCGMPGGSSGPGDPNLLIFQHDQFSADYHRNKENIPTSENQQCFPQKGVFEANNVCYTRRQINRAPQPEQLIAHKVCRPLVSRDDQLLDLSDIAAVALLDSLSGGSNRGPKTRAPPVVTGAVISKALAAESCASQAFSPGFAPTLSSSSPTTMGGIFSSIAETSQQPISSIGFDSGMAPAPFSMGAPFSSYRLTSLRTPDSMYGNGVFLGAAPRLHPTLRSSGGVNNSIISGNDSGIFNYNSRSDNNAAEPAASQILQLPQRLYNSQTRNSSIGTESYGHSHSRTGMGIAYAQQAHGHRASDSRGGEGWRDETLASINMNLPHAGHPSPSRTDFAGAIV